MDTLITILLTIHLQVLPAKVDSVYERQNEKSKLALVELVNTNWDSLFNIAAMEADKKVKFKK